MKETLQKERVLAVEKYRNGESPAAICKALGRSKFWLYKWLNRYKSKKKALVRRSLKGSAALSGPVAGRNRSGRQNGPSAVV